MLIGHQTQWQFLRRAAELQRQSHAYLFSGQEQIGKKKTAIEFVKLLNCRHPGLKPCESCRPCQDIARGVYPDFILVESEDSKLAPLGASSLTGEIKIGQIRDLRSRLLLSPFVSRLKSVVIDDAHLLNREAESALLKTLEEPKGETLFILVSEFPKMLLPTILSRTETLRFHPVKKNEIEKGLRERGSSEKLSQELAALSFGKPGRAINLLNNPELKASEEKTIRHLIKLSGSDIGDRFSYAKELSQSEQNLGRVLDVWLRYFRGLFISEIEKREESKNSPLGAAAAYSPAKIKKIIGAIQNISYLLSSTNVGSRLALEMIMLEL